MVFCGLDVRSGVPIGTAPWLIKSLGCFFVCQETASHFPAETFGFGVHNWLLKVCRANFFVAK